MPEIKNATPSDTPETDAWCELAMHADVSSVLELAMKFERDKHKLELENASLKQSLMIAKWALQYAYKETFHNSDENGPCDCQICKALSQLEKDLK